VGLAKRYGDALVVRPLDLEIRGGECFGFLGPNGAGKTTTLRMMLGLTPPSAGTLTVLGFPVPDRAREMRARAGVVPQQDNLDPDFTVRENLRVYGSYYGIPRAILETRIEELIAFAALESKAEAPIATLSGGMRRRLTIARALVNDPELLFLDEPTTGLDPQARHLIWRRLRGLATSGRTLLLTTHNMEEAQRLCDRLIVMDRGQVLDLGTPRELIDRHIEPYVLELSGEGIERLEQGVPEAGALRAERVGDTLFCYARDPAALAAAARTRPEVVAVQRPASLEDVFLKLTGRDLRD
jgi:lipooligosaccharide transport system ATP-binding protein